jgi:hypothetical protein
MFGLRENERLRDRQIGNQRRERRRAVDRPVEERIIRVLLIVQMVRLEVHTRQVFDGLIHRRRHPEFLAYLIELLRSRSGGGAAGLTAEIQILIVVVMVITCDRSKGLAKLTVVHRECRADAG